MLSWVFECSSTHGSNRLVLLSLADRANERGVCWPSIADIAARAALSERQTRRVLAALVRAGEVRIIRPGGGKRRDGAGWTNRFLVTAGRSAAELDTIAAEPCHTRQGSNRQSPDAGDRKPGHARLLTLSRATTNTDAGDRETTSRARVESPRGPSDSADALGRCVREITGAAGSRNGGTAMLDIQRILAECGCDASFRGVASRMADPRIIRKLAAKFDAKRHTIANPGGWWRDQLRRAGVKGI